MRFIIAGGGTGGHLFPGLAIAQEIKRRLPEATVLFVGTEGGLESKVLPRGELITISSAGLARRVSMRTFIALWKAFKGVVQSFIVLHRVRPMAVVGTGGFVSGPVVLAALLWGIPCLLQEQNALPGLTTRLLSRLVDCVHLGLTGSPVRGRHVFISGTPVRREVISGDREESISHLGLDRTRRTVLVLGGSQGARSINRAMVQGLGQLAEENVQLIWQTGKDGYQAAKEAMDRHGLPGAVRPFFDDMGAVYGAADLAICRAGATTIAEITARGIATILIPYPYSTDGHQLMNAHILAKAGAAKVLYDEALPSGALVDQILELLRNPETMESMARHSRAMGRPEAAHTIVDSLLMLCSGKRDTST